MTMNSLNFIFCLLIITTSNLIAQTTYSWPILPYPNGKKVISGYCAYRPKYNTLEKHFHEGIDIPAGTHEIAKVYPVTLSFKVVKISGSGDNKRVNIRNYRAGVNFLNFY